MADSVTFKIEIKGIDEILSRYEQAPEIVERILQQAIIKSTAILASHTTHENIPWRTGTLARSFDPAKIDRLMARWFPRVEYAQAVQFGRDPEPGRYVPAIGKRLKNGKNIGMWPGFKGANYMEKIMGASQSEIDELFGNALKAITSKMTGNTTNGQSGSINILENGASSSHVSGTTSNLSRMISKVSRKAGAKFDQLTYRPFKGAPRGYQIRLAKKFPKLFKRWNIDNM